MKHQCQGNRVTVYFVRSTDYMCYAEEEAKPDGWVLEF